MGVTLATKIARKLGDIPYPVKISPFTVPGIPSLKSNNECYFSTNAYWGLQGINTSLNPAFPPGLDGAQQIGLAQAAIYSIGPFGIFYEDLTLPDPFVYYPQGSKIFSLTNTGGFYAFGPNSFVAGSTAAQNASCAFAQATLPISNLAFENGTASPNVVNDYASFTFSGCSGNFTGFTPYFILEHFTNSFILAGSSFDSFSSVSRGSQSNIVIGNSGLPINGKDKNFNTVQYYFGQMFNNVFNFNGNFLVDPILGNALCCANSIINPNGYIYCSVYRLDGLATTAPEYGYFHLSNPDDDADMGIGNNGSPLYSQSPGGGFLIWGWNTTTGQVSHNLYFVARDFSSYYRLIIQPASSAETKILTQVLVSNGNGFSNWGFDFAGDLWVNDTTFDSNTLIGAPGFDRSITLSLFQQLQTASIGCRLYNPNTSSWEF